MEERCVKADRRDRNTTELDLFLEAARVRRRRDRLGRLRRQRVLWNGRRSDRRRRCNRRTRRTRRTRRCRLSCRRRSDGRRGGGRRRCSDEYRRCRRGGGRCVDHFVGRHEAVWFITVLEIDADANTDTHDNDEAGRDDGCRTPRFFVVLVVIHGSFHYSIRFVNSAARSANVVPWRIQAGMPMPRYPAPATNNPAGRADSTESTQRLWCGRY